MSPLFPWQPLLAIPGTVNGKTSIKDKLMPFRYYYLQITLFETSLKNLLLRMCVFKVNFQKVWPLKPQLNLTSEPQPLLLTKKRGFKKCGL